MAVDAQPPNARPTPSCRTASDRRGGVWSQRPNRQTTCPRCGASTATPTILLRTCCRRQAGRGSRDAGGRACQSVDRDHRVQYRPSDRGVRSGFPGQGSSAPLLRIARSSRSIDTGRQPVEQKLNLKRITSAASRSPAGRGDALRAPASHASRDRRTAQAHRSSPSGKSNQQGGSEQPARSSTAAPAAQLHSTSDRDSQQRGICSVRQKNFAKKEERLAPLNFLSALALRLRVVVKRHTSALHCGQIVRSSRLTLNKSL